MAAILLPWRAGVASSLSVRGVVPHLTGQQAAQGRVALRNSDEFLGRWRWWMMDGGKRWHFYQQIYVGWHAGAWSARLCNKSSCTLASQRI